MSSSDPRDALEAMFRCLQGTFKKYDRSARKKAWHAIESGPGKSQVRKLLDSPDRPLVGLPRLLSFKEWLAHQP